MPEWGCYGYRCSQARGLPCEVMDALLNALQWPAMGLTWIATWFLASQKKRKIIWGHWCFVVSNVLWGAWGWHDHAYGLIALQCGLFWLNFQSASKNEALECVPELSDVRQAHRLPGLARNNLQFIADLAERDEASVSHARAAIEWFSSIVGTPRFFVFTMLFIVCWVGVNLVGVRRGWTYIDKPPFYWLQGLVTSCALLLTIAILIRQDRMAELARHRAHLDLQINLLTERKATKALEMLNELRKGNSQATDAEFDELIKPIDVAAIMRIIKRHDSAGAS